MNFGGVRSICLAALAFSALLSSCATSQVPGMTQARAAMLAIDVTLRPPLGDTRGKPAVVFLAKIDDDGSLLQKQFIRTNYVKDGRAYLLNAAPGTYVAFAAYENPPMLVTTADSLTYFSKQLVEQTKVTLTEGAFAFMGSFEVAQAAWADQADEVQVHYRSVLAPMEPKGIVAQVLNKVTSYRGTPGAPKDAATVRARFVQDAQKDLAGSQWLSLVR
jgi:hypothetical protein